jgi:ribosome-associated translation inhibitor RaiA
MEIIFHSHHAAISPRLQQRAEQSIHKLVERMGRAVDAVIRFEEDGPTRRVEVLLHAPRGRRLVARGEGRNFGPALTAALDRLSARVDRVRTRRAVARKAGREGDPATKTAPRRRLARA